MTTVKQHLLRITAMSITRYVFFLFLAATLLTGCLTTYDDKGKIITRLAQSLNASPDVIETHLFDIQTFARLTRQSTILRVYIEGDGKAWASRRRPSLDPTPHNLMLSELMRQDTYSDRAYLARPCQFVWGEHCKIPVWTSLRYSQPMVDTLNDALDQLKTKGPYQNIELIGFSGGGTLALLLAARRDDVLSVRTIAGNLDPAFVNAFHKVSPMPDSLNPVDFSRQLATIPQLHFIGGKDRVITPAVYDHYASFFHPKNCLSRYMNTNAGHNNGWESNWSELLRIPVQCR